MCQRLSRILASVFFQVVIYHIEFVSFPVTVPFGAFTLARMLLFTVSYVYGGAGQFDPQPFGP